MMFFLNWDPCKREQLVQGMEIKEKESQKGKVCARNVQFRPLDKLEISEIWSRWVWGPAMKVLNGVRGKSPEIFDCFTLIRL